MADGSKTPNGLKEALDSIAQIILGEQLQSLHEAVKATESRLGRQIEDLKRELSATIDVVQKDLQGRTNDLTRSLDALKKSVDTTTTDLSVKIQKSGAELNDKVIKLEEQAQKELAGARNSMESRLNTFEDQTREALTSVNDSMGVQSSQIEDLRRESQKFGGILSGFAKIFSGGQMFDQSVMQPTAPLTPPPPPAPRQQQPAATAPRPQTPPPPPPVPRPAQAPAAQRPAPQQPPVKKDETRLFTKSQLSPSGDSKGGNPQRPVSEQQVSDESLNLPDSNDIARHIDEMFNLGGNK